MNMKIAIVGLTAFALALVAADPPAEGPTKVEAEGVPNLIRLTDRIYQGAMPQGDAGFASLEKLGVKTVISVDGALPDLEDAHKHGILYVHLPFGYDGLPRDQALRIVKAVRDLPGPVYIHCHRGTVRGPTAAAVVRIFLDDQCSVETALDGMKLAGFDRRYSSLWTAPKVLIRPTAKELDAVASDFPEASPPAGLKQFMVDIDATLGNLQAIRKAEWATPKDKPDLDPPHEALQMVEHFKELQRLPKTAERPEDFRKKLAEAEARAEGLEAMLRVAKGKMIDPTAAENAYKQLDGACLRCHTLYRDVPK